MDHKEMLKSLSKEERSNLLSEIREEEAMAKRIEQLRSKRSEALACTAHDFAQAFSRILILANQGNAHMDRCYAHLKLAFESFEPGSDQMSSEEGFSWGGQENRHESKHNVKNRDKRGEARADSELLDPINNLANDMNSLLNL